MERRDSNEVRSSLNGDFGFGVNDRRFAFSRQASFQQSQEPHTSISVYSNGSTRPSLSRSDSSIHIPWGQYWTPEDDKFWGERKGSPRIISFSSLIFWVFGNIMSGHRYMKWLFFYDFTECSILDCRVIDWPLHWAYRKKADRDYTYGQLFLLFLSFSLAVEALHAFIQDESEHKNAEDMNNHSVFLHVLADSICSAGLILASWLLLGVRNAEVLCLGLVSVSVFMLVLPLFRTTNGILLQMAPPSIPTSALSKCLRQITAREEVLEVSQAHFWELLLDHVVGSISSQVKKGIDDCAILGFVHVLYQDLGVHDPTVQIDSV